MNQTGQPGARLWVPPPTARPLTTRETSGDRGELGAAEPGVGGRGMTANAEPGSGLEPLPAPSPRSAPRALGPTASRTHRVPLSLMVRGGRRKVRGVSAQAGKSPAGRRSAGQPAPGSLLRLLRSRASAAAAAAPASARSPPAEPPAALHSTQAAARGVEQCGECACVCACARVCARVGCARASQPAARPGRVAASGPAGHVGVRTGACPDVCVCSVREGARRGGYT